jgi:ribonuclease P protein component
MSTPYNSLRALPELESGWPPRKQSLAGARLRKHADFQRAYQAAHKRQSASMSWFLALRSAGSEVASDEAPGPRLGLTVGKVLGKAHERNRIKRRMREALRRHVNSFPVGCDLIFHPRRIVLTMDFTKLEEEIVRILRQANAEAGRIRSNSPRRAPPAAAS